MITTRIIDKNHYDYNKMCTYLRKKGVDSPYSKLYIVEYDNDEIVGVCGLDTVVRVEPLLTNSAHISEKLYRTALGMCLADPTVNRIEGLVDDEHLPRCKDIYKKLGFTLFEKINRFVKIIRPQ